MAFVYFFQNGETDYFKIGRTKSNVEKRRKELSTGNPALLSIFEVIETEHDSLVENFFHKKFHANLCEEGDSKEFYKINPRDLRDGIKEAIIFLDDYILLQNQVDQYANLESCEEVAPASDESTAIIGELRKIKGQKALLEFEENLLENRLKLQIGSYGGIEGLVSWKSQVRKSLDQNELKLAYPDLVLQFTKETRSRTLRLL